MISRHSLFIAIAALSLSASAVYAGPGGNGNGNGGNSAGAGSHGHGAATSEAARDPATSGLTKALSVVATTPASPQATSSLQAALDAFLLRHPDDTE